MDCLDWNWKNKMKNNEVVKCDALVIGRGLAGMAAAARTSTLGLDTVQAGSASSLFLHSGLIDLLGVYPINKKQILSEPESGLVKLIADMSQHPYASIGISNVLKNMGFIRNLLEEGGLTYQNENNQNQLVLTSAGTFKPSFLVPKTMVAGNRKLLRGKKILIVGFKGLKAFSARQVADMIDPICEKATDFTVEIPEHMGELTPLGLANLFESNDLVDILVELLSFQKIQKFDRIGFPAVLGLNQCEKIIKTLEDKLGCPCFEIPGLPPSIPGQRLRNAFEKLLSNRNVRVLNNVKIRFDTWDKSRFVLTAQNQNIQQRIEAKAVILATGRFQGKGLYACQKTIRETVFNLPVSQPERRSEWYDQDFFTPNGHRINQAGIQTNKKFQPLDENGQVIYDRLFVTGSVLAHNDWIRFKSGSGVACASAVAAGNHLFEAIKGEFHG